MLAHLKKLCDTKKGISIRFRPQNMEMDVSELQERWFVLYGSRDLGFLPDQGDY